MSADDPLFEMWQELKPNTQIRTAMWLNDGCPLRYDYIDDVPTIATSSAPFRNAVLAASPTDVSNCRTLVLAALALRGIRDLRPRQVPDTSWAKKLKGRRQIAWTPAPVEKDAEG